MPGAWEFASERWRRLCAGFVRGRACDVSEDVQREYAPESVRRSPPRRRARRGRGRRSRAIASGLPPGPARRATAARGSGAPPRGAARRCRRRPAATRLRCSRVPGRRARAPDDSGGGRPRCSFSALLSNWSLSARVSGRRQYVDHVNRDAEAGARGNGAREHGDRPANQMVLVAFGQLLAASLGVAVATGELLVRPATCEPVVGGGEIAHGSVREHDVNARALPRAGGRSFQQRDAAGAAPYLLGSHGRLADCRPRAPLAARAPRGRGRGRGAWPRDGAHDAHARGPSGQPRP